MLIGSAWATPVLVYDHNGYVTGINHLKVGNTYLDAVFLGDDVSFNQALLDPSITFTLLRHIGTAYLAANAVAQALDNAPTPPALVASSAGNGAIVNDLILPDLYFPSASPYLAYGWYIVYSGSTKQWLFTNTNPSMSIHTVFATGHAVQGRSLVAFLAGDPTDPSPAVPAPPTAALLVLGIGLLGAGLRRGGDTRPNP